MFWKLGYHDVFLMMLYAISTTRGRLLLVCFVLLLLTPCHCASIVPSTATPIDQVLDGDDQGTPTLLQLCTKVHSYLAISFWKAINQNPSLLFSFPYYDTDNPGDSRIVERRGYKFRLFFRTHAGKRTIKEDVKGDIDQYVNVVVKEIEDARTKGTLPISMKRFIPKDQHGLLQEIFQSSVMSDEVMTNYCEYVKGMAEYRLKLLPEKTFSGGQWYDMFVKWATTLPDEDFYRRLNNELDSVTITDKFKEA
eukprot:Nk52_evm46s210 gene=Nk52_evmTU46s210